MLPSHNPHQNHLLAALPADEYARLFPHLELVFLPLGNVLYESGIQLRHAYFPTTAIVSLLYVMENGASTEIAVIGNEGVASVSPSSWAAKPRPTELSCKAPATPIA